MGAISTLRSQITAGGELLPPLPDAVLVAESNLADLPNKAAAREALGVKTPAELVVADNEVGNALAALTAPAPATAVRMWAGRQEPTSFRVCYDLTTPAPTLLAVSLNADMSSPVFTSAATTPAASPGISTTYYPVIVDVSGLNPNTQYYYQARVSGQPSGPIHKIKTFPAAGQPASFRFVFGSCSLPYDTRRPDRIYSAIAKENALFFAHLGDIDYPDVDFDDIRITRSRNGRVWRSNPDVLKLLQATGIVYTFSDHDSAENDNHFDYTYISKTTNTQIIANARQVIHETTPIYEPIDSRTIAQKFDVGRCRFLLPDDRSQRRWQVGTPTALGTGTNPPGSWDQLSWFLNELSNPGLDIKLMFPCLGSTVTAVDFDSWLRYFPAEERAVYDALHASTCAAAILSGDSHQGAFLDGSSFDPSTNSDTHLPVLVSSPLSHTTLFTSLSGLWNGVEKLFTGNSSLYVVVDVVDNGGSDLTWTATAKGYPVDPVTFEPTTLGQVSSADATNVVGFQTTGNLIAATGTDAALYVAKSWIGPIADGGGAGCKVDWALGSGASGTLTFKPNSSREAIIVNRPGGTVSDTLSLSNPHRCTLGGTLSKTITFFDNISSDVAAYLSQMVVLPNQARVAALNTFVDALKSAGVWTKLRALWLLAAHHPQAALINLVAPGILTLTAQTPPGSTAPTFVTDRYAACDGVGSYFETGFNPSGDSLFTQDSNSFGMRFINSLSAPGASMGNTSFTLNPLSASNTRTRNSGTTTATTANTVGSGLFVVSRTDPEKYAVYKDGASLGAVDPYITAAPNPLTIWLGAWHGSPLQYSARQMASAFLGSGLTSAEVLAFNNAEKAYMQAIGAVA